MASIGITRARRRAFRRLALAQVAAFAVSGIAFTTGPLTVLDLSGSAGLAGLVLALLGLSGGAGAWAGGRLVDRFGRVRPLTGAHALAGAAGLAAAAGALLGSPALVLAACVPLGAGQGAALLGRVAVAAMHPPEVRGRATGRLVVAGAAGAVAGLEWTEDAEPHSPADTTSAGCHRATSPHAKRGPVRVRNRARRAVRGPWAASSRSRP